MKKLIIVTIGLFLPFLLLAQTEDVPKILFSDIVVDDNYLYGLDSSGKLSIWTSNSLEKVYVSKEKDIFFQSIAKDTNNTIYLGTNKGQILKLDTKDFSTSLFLQLKKPIEINYLVFNRNNAVFTIGHYGVYDPVKDKYWRKFKNESTGMVVRRSFLQLFMIQVKQPFIFPSYVFLDSKNILWMTRNYGEFGSSLQRFDTQNKAIINEDIEGINLALLAPQSIFEDDQQNVYLTSGCEHISARSEVYQMDANQKKARIIYNSKTARPNIPTDDTITIAANANLYIGPCQYNPQDKQLYMPTTLGFYKAPIPRQGSIKDPTFIFRPTLTWNNRPIVKHLHKLAFTKDNKIVFLTYYNGIGVYDQRTGVVQLLD